MKTQHTPGPWRLAYQENGKLEMGGSTTHYTGVYSSVGFGIIAEVIYKTTNILGDSKILEYQTFEANAKLIAAAPELLASLQKLMKYIDDQFLVRNTERDGEPDFYIRMAPFMLDLKEAVEAIKKAE